MLLWLAALQDLQTESVEYKHGDVVLEGYLAQEKGKTQRRPGILIVHEWKGLGDYVKRRAEQIASLGYVAFAIDMYGKGKRAKDHEEAAELSGVYLENRRAMRERAKAGLDRLLIHPHVDSTRIAAMGYCFGGTAVLEMARAGYDVKIVGSFHGGLGTLSPAQAGKTQSRVVVFHGAADRWVGDPEDIKREMEQAKVDFRFHSFDGAVHSFTVKEAGDDPKEGMAYDEKADRQSWQLWTKYLEEAFRK